MKKMQNEPNFLKSKMNVSSVKTKNYENKRPSGHRQNEPNTNPIYGKTNPTCRGVASGEAGSNPISPVTNFTYKLQMHL